MPNYDAIIIGTDSLAQGAELTPPEWLEWRRQIAAHVLFS
jgi:hypothetical protein